MSLTKDETASSIGIRLIEADHDEIARLLVEVQATVAAGSGRHLILDILGRLAAFTRTHFALEEGLMVSTGYSGYGEHRRRHQYLLQELDGFTFLYSMDKLELDQAPLMFLYSWLAVHSQNDDAQYVAWLAARDVAPGQTGEAIPALNGWAECENTVEKGAA